jgi:hypothetical protein
MTTQTRLAVVDGRAVLIDERGERVPDSTRFSLTAAELASCLSSHVVQACQAGYIAGATEGAGAGAQAGFRAGAEHAAEAMLPALRRPNATAAAQERLHEQEKIEALYLGAALALGACR